MLPTTKTTGYETDFALWIEETVKNLKAKNFNQVDWDNVIEEIESLGKSQRSAVRSYLDVSERLPLDPIGLAGDESEPTNKTER